MLQSVILIVFVIALFAVPLLSSLITAIRYNGYAAGDLSSVSPRAKVAMSILSSAIEIATDEKSKLRALAKRIERMLEQAAAILIAIEMDTHACVRPDAITDHDVRAEVILADVGAFSGDAQIAQDRTVLRNEPLRTLQQIRSTVATIFSDIAVAVSLPFAGGAVDVHVDVENRVREITKANLIVDQELIDMQSRLVIACEEQRTRFATTRPALAAYTFHSHSIHNPDTVPLYEFGTEKVLATRNNIKGIADHPPSNKRTIAYTGEMMTPDAMEKNQPARNAMDALS